MKNLQYFESLIDASDFQTILAYLTNPQSPIEMLVHVKDRCMLSRVAEEMVRTNELDPERSQLSLPLYEKLLRQGELKVSPQLVTPLYDRKFLVDPFEIPRNSTSYVIYLPPFYLVHTPGLFEGTLIKPETAKPHVSEPQTIRPSRRTM